MECAEARKLIDRGIPTLARRQQADLDHHIAGCAECAAYLAHTDAALLTHLLGQDARRNPYETRALRPPVALKPIERTDAPVGRLSSAPPGRRSPPKRLPAPVGPRRRRWPTIVAGVVAVLLCAAVLRVATPLLALRQSVEAMQIATPTLASISTVVPKPVGTQQAASVPTIPAATPATANPAAPIAEASTPDANPTATPLTWPTAAGVVQTPTFTPQAVIPIAPLIAAGPTLMPIAPLGEAPAAGAPVNVLLLGIDRRPGETAPVRADSIIVLRLDPQRQRVAMLSLPRDLMVQIPNYGVSRINAAHAHGEVMYGEGGGITLTRQTVAQLLDIPIHYVVQVDFSGFVAGIDALGGVTIDVPQALYDAEYPTMDYGYQEVAFSAGTQEMDGARALIYARIRHMDSDVERMRRQQQVIMAALGRVRGQNMLGQLDTTARLASALRSYVRFDIPEDRLVGLVWAFRTVQPAAVERYTLDENMVQQFVLPDDPYASFPLPGVIDDLVTKLIGT